MKTNTELEFIKYCKSIRNPYHFDTDEFMIMIGFLKSEAIAEHEALQWKPYPDNRPEISQKCLITFMDGEVAIGAIWGKNAPWDENYVVAFRELPEPYRKEPQP